MFAEGIIQEADYVAAQFLHLRSRPVFAVIGILLLAIFVWVFVISASLIMLGVVTYFIVLFAIYIPWRAKRNFRQYKALSEPISVETREDGLFFKRQNGEGLVPWSHIHKWRHNKKLILLYPASNIFHMVPSHFFGTPESYGEFVKIIEEHVGNAS